MKVDINDTTHVPSPGSTEMGMRLRANIEACCRQHPLAERSRYTRVFAEAALRETENCVRQFNMYRERQGSDVRAGVESSVVDNNGRCDVQVRLYTVDQVPPAIDAAVRGKYRRAQAAINKSDQIDAFQHGTAKYVTDARAGELVGVAMSHTSVETTAHWRAYAKRLEAEAKAGHKSHKIDPMCDMFQCGCGTQHMIDHDLFAEGFKRANATLLKWFEQLEEKHARLQDSWRRLYGERDRARVDLERAGAEAKRNSGVKDAPGKGRSITIGTDSQ